MLTWLSRPIVADDHVLASPLDPTRLTNADLLPIGLRMHAIMDTIEMPRCEGRLIPVKLFDAMDCVTDSLRHPNLAQPDFAGWVAVASEFGQYYDLEGCGPITVDLEHWHRAVEWLRPVTNAAPGAAADGGA